MSDIEIKAKLYATTKHRGQKRKDGRTPYIRHPEYVVKLLKGWGVTCEDTLAAAWLHDVVEDTDTSLPEVEDMFNSRVAVMVDCLTRRHSFEDEKINRIAYQKRLLEAPSEVRLIKLADIIANLSDMGRARWKDSNKRNIFFEKKMDDLKVLMQSV